MTLKWDRSFEQDDPFLRDHFYQFNYHVHVPLIHCHSSPRVSVDAFRMRTENATEFM